MPSNTTVFEIFLIALRNVLYISWVFLTASTSRSFPGTFTLQSWAWAESVFSLKKTQPKQQATTVTATSTFLDVSQPLSSRLHDTQPLQTFSRKSKYNFHGRCELPSSPWSSCYPFYYSPFSHVPKSHAQEQDVLMNKTKKSKCEKGKEDRHWENG